MPLQSVEIPSLLEPNSWAQEALKSSLKTCFQGISLVTCHLQYSRPCPVSPGLPRGHLAPACRGDHSKVWVGSHKHRIPDTFMLTALKSKVGCCLAEAALWTSPCTPQRLGLRLHWVLFTHPELCTGVASYRSLPQAVGYIQHFQPSSTLGINVNINSDAPTRS